MFRHRFRRQTWLLIKIRCSILATRLRRLKAMYAEKSSEQCYLGGGTIITRTE